SVHPRVVVQRALELKVCAAAICHHSHPSGDPSPSQADEVITRKLKSALALVEVRLLDHIIVSSIGSVSLAERGII
ncbi:JAB domain-containing protein, partial [Arthrospira platensis SPKY2]